MKDHFQRQIKSLGRLLVAFALILAFVLGGILYLNYNPGALNSSSNYEILPSDEIPLVELDTATISRSGFINDHGVSQVIQNCTQCHSAKLVTQNRMSMEGWESTITWMQETQNLWELGDKKQKIAEYLGEHYAPKKVGRRKALEIQEWYLIE